MQDLKRISRRLCDIRGGPRERGQSQKGVFVTLRYHNLPIIFMVIFHSKLINYPWSSQSCTSSCFGVARWLWGLPNCQAGDFGVACPTTFIVEEFTIKERPRTTRTKWQKYDGKNQLDFQCAMHEQTSLQNREKEGQAPKGHTSDAAWLPGCWCFAGPCLALLPSTPALTLPWSQALGCISHDTGQSNDPFAAQWWWKSIHRQAAPG